VYVQTVCTRPLFEGGWGRANHTPAIRRELSVPFVNTTPTACQQGTSSAPFQAATLPIKAANPDKALPSNVIQKEKLKAPNEIFAKYPNLHCVSKVKTLAVKLVQPKMPFLVTMF